MMTQRLVLHASLLLLVVSAFAGFVQYRHRDEPESFARWRVVHAGGTGGAVQLLGLVVLAHLWGNQLAVFSLALVAVAMWAFFLGPLAKALGNEPLARRINGAGSFFAVPGYLALPFSFTV